MEPAEFSQDGVPEGKSSEDRGLIPFFSLDSENTLSKAPKRGGAENAGCIAGESSCSANHCLIEVFINTLCAKPLQSLNVLGDCSIIF